MNAMKRLSCRILPAFLIAISISYTSVAQTITQAKEMIEEGDCSGAIEVLKQVVKSKPKDAEASYLLGTAYLYDGDKNMAEEEFLSAQKKGSLPAIYQLADIELNRYNVNKAQTYIEEYRKGLKKAKKGTVNLSEDFDNRLDKISAMLDRVEKIVILDSIEVDADTFFKQYGLAETSGTFNLPAVLPKGFISADPTVVFETGDNRERIWATEADDNTFHIVTSKALINGKWTEPTFTGGQLNEGGDANYPFLMPDGVTLYFANDGENSLGGYDIFITRRDGEEFLQPTNIGFPYNSPYDDYLLAIDESRGLGWWATNRNGHKDYVTIYTFIPSDIRINYEIDNPELAALARIESFKATWEGKDYTSQQREARRLPEKVTSTDDPPLFSINIPGKGIYSSLNQFKSNTAANMMKQYLVSRSQLEDLEKELSKARIKYRTNRTAEVSGKILEMEKEVESKRSTLSVLRKDIISSENGQSR